MNDLTIQIRTGSRLHFGLWEVAPCAPHAFGGMGMMVRQPELELVCRGPWRAAPDVQVRCPGPLRDPCRHQVERWISGQADSLLPSVLEVRASSHSHSGLGSGTQLACAIAAALLVGNRWVDPPAVSPPWHSLRDLLGQEITPAELIRHTGRGKRSWVGTAGFLYGGLILDEGEESRANQGTSDPLGIAPRAIRGSDFPDHWRVVLVAPRTNIRVYGRREAELFGRLGRRANPAQPQMHELARSAVAAAAVGDFDAFCGAVEQYTVRAGELFAPVQGGLYNGPAVAQAVEAARSAGLRAVGQSSWGPTVFGFAASSDSADKAIRDLSANPELTVLGTEVLSTGALCRRVARTGDDVLRIKASAFRWQT